MARRCNTCNWTNSHGAGCPEPLTGTLRVQAQVEYRRGWNAGRGGENRQADQSASYNLGWNNGMCALEAAENGDPYSTD